MAGDTEDLVLSISADVRQMQRALSRLTGDTAKTTAVIQQQFDSMGDVGGKAFDKIADNGNRAFSKGSQSAAKFGQAMKVSSLQTGNLAAQINDIGVQLAGGQSPFLIALQQGTQINQVLGQGGARGAVAALGGAFASLINPVSLATIAIIGLGGAAVQYVTSFLGDSKDMAKALKEEAELIDKVAQKWGDALPALKKYNDERKRLQEETEITTAVEAVAQGEYEKIREIIKDVRGEIGRLVVDLQQAGTEDTDILKLQKVFNTLFEEVEAGNAKFERLRQVQAALNDLFKNTGIPAAKDMADSIGQIADELERAIDAANQLRAENAIRDFFQRTPLGTLGGLGPITSGGGQFLNPGQLQDFRASNTPSQFERDLERASGAIDSFVDRVIKAESGGDPNAKNRDSSATGVGQFLKSTWLELFRRHFPERAQTMGRDAILELRKDADVSRSLIRAYAKENAAVLQRAGVSVNEAALQLSHFLGAGDAAKVLRAAPGTPLAGLISQASINANPTILGGGRTVDDAISYAERRASASTSTRTAREKRTPADIFAGSTQQIQARIDLINAEIEAQGRLNPLIEDYGFEVEKARIKQHLLNDAKKAGVEVTPALAAQIDQLAGNYARASASADQLRASQERAAQAAVEFSEFSKDLLGGFIQDLREGKDASEAFANALQKVGDKLLDVGLNALFGGGGGGLFGGGGGLFGGAIIPGILHNGGVAGQDGYGHGRAVSPSVFAGARRYHQGGVAGLMPGEVPAILQKGEVVIPKGSSAAAPQAVHVTVGVSADNNGNLMPFVESVSQRTATQTTRQGLATYDKQMNRSFGGRMAQAQAREL
ncbi:phage tail length tape measure family protein [Allomesorhizobium camelthorni]|uniref:Bacteriophage tail tape measure N-terminal domain-containing protein n=1 Tax=Allomesorhizobium camelthorni TaxID=475069 RepID=A0A6G4WB96_9HYPH|nr:phage tail length tape measure family protein [Mesorhizobium camelthorni]NGO51608.1 hypothetical protein [Mesorhizobium camelthorni]